MLKIKNLKISIDNKEIIKDLNLEIKQGEIHALMGPNGSGKSTLSNVLAGKDGYNVTGEILYKGEDLLKMSIEERARKGLFMAFQYPIEIPGVNTINFLKSSLNVVRKSNKKEALDTFEFLDLVKEKAKVLNVNGSTLNRHLNVGFSGGEKKKNEILQMSVLEPMFAILDETDSGLDIDSLKIISNGINSLRSICRSFLIITHYQRLLEHIKPDFVHVLVDGSIIKTGCSELAEELEKVGYGNKKQL